MSKVSLVATEAIIRQYFSEAEHQLGPNAGSGILSADFGIVPESCKTELGRFLASNVMTTRFDDDASSCAVLLPITEFGMGVKALAATLNQQTGVANADAAERMFRSLEEWIEKQRKVIRTYGSHAFRYRVIHFTWPVFGSAAAGEARTPEEYFDLCGGLIRATGGVLLCVGLNQVEPPQSLQRSMSKGAGLELIRRYKATQTNG